MRKILFIALAILLFAPFANANNDSDIIKKYIPTFYKVGEGNFNFLLWPAYKATLYAPNGKYISEKPTALRLEYLRDIDGSDITEKTISEIKKQGFNNEQKISRWQSELDKIFPDVEKGTVLTGILTDKGSTIFYNGEEKIGEIKDKEFGKRFFDIWLSEKTSEPGLRKDLLGIKK